MAEKTKFTIVGSGLGGALMAAYLGQNGHPVDLYEKREDPRNGRELGGRSINLALSTRGIHALKEVGIADDVMEIAIPMKGRLMHAVDGSLSFHPYGRYAHEVIHSVSRAELNRRLVEKALGHPNVAVRFDHRCLDADLETGEIELEHTPTGEKKRVPCASVIGADGAYSAVRARMMKREGFNYEQHYLEHGYKELTIPPAADGSHRIEKNALHIWPRGSFMMIALPNLDGSFTVTIFWPYEGKNSFSEIRTGEQAVRFFEKTFPDAIPLMPTLAEDFENNPTGSLVTIRCGPWHYKDRFVLLGDAAHAVVPFYGQGMNAAFEDCTILAECLQKHPGDRETAFRAYFDRRKEDTDALADLAIENFIEMRDKVASKRFLLKKKGQLLLSKLFPKGYLPLYNMVTFTRMPYAQARRRALLQDELAWRTVLFLILAGAVFLFGDRIAGLFSS